MKSIFNKKLFKEGLKQNFLTGIIFFIIFEFISIIVAVGQVSSSLSYEARTGHRYITTVSDFFSVNPLLIVSFILLIPIMTICAFSFLNSRNKSDFYHSIPHKRQTVFISFTLSILVWLIAIFFVTLLTSFTIFLIFSKYFTLVFSSFFINIFCVISACVLVLGAGLIAMTLTGTLFSNIVTAGLILFLPRIILTLFSTIVSSLAPTLAENSLAFLDPKHNVVFGFIASMFNMGSSVNSLNNIWSGVYTLILGFIFIAIAGFLFVHRKSEAAGSPAASKKVQAVIRISLSFLVSSVASCILVSLSNSSDSISSVIYLYIASLLVYFIYEAITAKSFKNLHKVIPGVGILVGLNIIFVSAVLLTSNSIMNVNWKSDEIESISISYTEDPYNDPTYEDLKLSKTKINDADVIKQTAEILLENQSIFKDTSTYRYNYRELGHVIIRTKNGKTYHRKLYMSEKEFESYQQTVLKSDLKEKVFSDMPKNPTEVSIYSDTHRSLGNLSPEQSKELYDFFKAEVDDLPVEAWANLLISKNALSSTFPNASNYALTYDVYDYSGHDDYINPIDLNNQNAIVFDVTGYIGTKMYNSRYIVTDITPQTLTEIYEQINKNSLENEKDTWNNFVKNGIPKNSPYEEYVQFAISDAEISAYHPSKNLSRTDYLYSYEDLENKNYDKIFAEIDKVVKEEDYKVDVKKPYVIISVSGEEYFQNNGEVFSGSIQSFSFCVNIDETLLNDDFFLTENGELLMQ